MHSLIQAEALHQGIKINSIGGLTLGADPISLAVGMYSAWIKETPPLQTFIVRKAAKDHGQAKLIEGNFKSGDLVAVVDDVVTRGDSTISAIDAVVKEGGRVAFVAVLVDRQEGGRQKIEQSGYHVVSAFERDEVVRRDTRPQELVGRVTAP